MISWERVFVKCEECGETMQWRCTNQETGVAKYKCPTCGNVQCGPDEWKEPVVKVNMPKHYYKRENCYIVRRIRNGKHQYIGCYGNEETAKKVVDKMNEIDWDKSKLSLVHNELNIKRINRSWVCA